MSIRWHWVAPDPQTFVSGGNAYNAALMQAQQRRGQMVRRYSPLEWLADMPRQPGDITLWDSLYLGELEPERHSRLARLWLLAHFIPENGLSCLLQALPYLEGILVPGQGMAQRLRQIGVPDARLFVLEPAGGALPRAMLPAPTGRLRLLWVANLLPEKGVLDLVRAMADASSSWTHLQIDLYGETDRLPSYTARVREQCQRWSDPAVLQLQGVVPPAVLHTAMSGADALLSASPFESYGMAVAEALQVGIPVLAVRGGHIIHQVREGEQGWLFEDVQALVSFLVKAEPEAFREAWPRPLPAPPPRPEWLARAAELEVRVAWAGKH